MKLPPSPFRLAKRDSFTLVEMLVVIGIIGILAAVSLQVGSVVIKAAKRAKAANTATQIQTACMNYYTEYSVYPVPSTATASTDYSITDSGSTADTAWANMDASLCGMINPSTGATVAASTSIPTNTRSIAFLTLKPSDVDGAGAPLNPLPTPVNAATTNNAFFNIMIDYDYDNVIGDSAASTVPNFTTSTKSAMTTYATGGPSGGVAVWANCNGSATSTNPNYWVHTY
jgi:prepilin-type N-terminal cleavage/methylation domain-containing protein